MWFYLLKNIHEKPFGFGHMHKDKIYFLCFWKEEINLIFFKKKFKEKFRRKPGIFNIGSVSYGVSLQHDIMQNIWKNMQGAHIYFKMPFVKFEIFFLFKFFFNMWILLYYLLIKWVGPGQVGLGRLTTQQTFFLLLGCAETGLAQNHMVFSLTQRPC